jgi:3-oxoacyl-[acyl-carrier protein] reductase
MKNPVALVTGGSRGIGLAIAKALVSNGYDVAINGVRDESSVADVLKDLKTQGADVLYCQGDISSKNDRHQIIEQIRKHFGRLHVLINNAGVAPNERMDPLAATEESYERVMRINLQGPYFLTQAIANWMIEQKSANKSYQGSIVNIGSISATVISTNRGEYCISKAGFGMHSKIWAVRLTEYDIPVYEVRPGVIKTDMTAGVIAKYEKLIADGLTVQKRIGEPEDVAKTVMALVSGAMPYSTGEVIMIDGGLTDVRL